MKGRGCGNAEFDVCVSGDTIRDLLNEKQDNLGDILSRSFSSVVRADGGACFCRGDLCNPGATAAAAAGNIPRASLEAAAAAGNIPRASLAAMLLSPLLMLVAYFNSFVH